MVRIAVETDIDAPPDVVWADLRNIAGHVEWMHDAESIWFTSPEREGVGTRFDCETKLGPVRLTDVMEITEWVEAESMGVTHSGLVTGAGMFDLKPLPGDRTRFSWTEDLSFPWWLGGRLGGQIGGRILEIVWKRNLANLAARFRAGVRVGDP